MFHAVISYWGIVCLWVLSIPYIYLGGGLLPLTVVAIELTGDNREPTLIARDLNRAAAMGLIPLLAFGANWLVSAIILTESHLAGLSFFWKYVVSLAVSLVSTFLLLRYVPQTTNRLKDKFTSKTDLERNRKSDVREIHKLLPAEMGAFDPTKLFPAQSKNELFVGLDEHKKPVYLEYESWKISHCLLTGRTRSGKGVAAQILLSQAIARGEYVVILDPKVDNWMPHIYKAACERAGLPYHFVDLRQNAGPQINPFAGCDAETIENMLVGGFSLTETGEASDFYRLLDRKAARRSATWLAENDGATARECIQAIGEKWDQEAPAFLSYMQEMAELPAVNRPAGTGGIDIAEGVKTGGCLYLVGDMVNPRIIRQQRMALLRLLFLAKNRDQINQGRTICVFADEFKVHISRPFITSLGASAGWGLHTLLAFQSLQDLSDCPADLDKDAVRGSVMENCGIQLSYAIKDPVTAEWLATSTGTILVDDETRQVKKNVALAEMLDHSSRSIRQSERHFIDTNMLMKMPKGCGVLSVVGRLEQFCFTSAVHATRGPEAVTPTAPPMPATAASVSGSVAAEMLALDDLPAAPEINEEPDPYSDYEPEAPHEPATPARGGALDLD